jgi:predicted peptidase
VGSCAVAVDLTKDDIDFRKEVYVDKNGDKLPCRLFVPIGYSSANTYPLVLWLHGGEDRGNDKIKQVARGNEKGAHVWISSEIQSKFPAFVLAPQCPRGRELVRPGIQSANQRAATGAGKSCQRRKTVRECSGAHLCCGPIDNFTAAMSISRIPLWVFQGDAERSVPVDLVREMMKQLRKLNANLRYT